MQHIARLRLSLLVSLGLVPIACGGTIRREPAEDNLTNGGTSFATGGNGSGPGHPIDPPGVTPTPGSAGRAVGGQHSVGGTTATGGREPIYGGAGGVGGEPPCASSTFHPTTGLVDCTEGYRHRPIAVECAPMAVGGAPSEIDSGAGGEAPVQTVPCRIDGDCSGSHICLCDSGVDGDQGRCVPSNCKTDSDCGAGSQCASYNGIDGIGFACLNAEDECLTSSDCRSDSAIHGYCTWDSGLGRRLCDYAVDGRPFFVECELRVAPLVADDAWSALEHGTPRVDHLTWSEREELAQRWSRAGQFEHASIAAFARFSLQLLAVGAPPELVESWTAALADETAHARLCFGIASTYAGHPVGPGPLDISGNLLPSSLIEIVDLVIAEGCFGETRAALEASQAGETASDPVIAASYRRIARDEQRHAELAFRFVGWALGQSPRAVKSLIARAIADAGSTDASAREVTVPCLVALVTAARPLGGGQPTLPASV